MNQLATAIQRAVQRFGTRLAVVDGDRELSFRALGERASRLANALVELGHQPRERVALLLPNSLEMLEADVAIALAGKTKVPINSRLTADERRHVLADSGASTLLVHRDEMDSLDACRAELIELREIIVVEGTRGEARNYEDVLASARPSPCSVAVDPSDPAVILYTSGTTGRPKGAVASFRSRWLTLLNMLTDELDVAPGDSMLHAGSMAHGSGSKAIPMFVRGACNVVMRKFEPEEFLILVESLGVTNSFVVPTMLAGLVEAQAVRRHDTATLKAISYGGAPISESLLAAALESFGPVLVQVYGSCEAPHPITVLSGEDHGDLSGGRAASIGRPTMGVQLSIAGEDGALGEGTGPGELLVGGETVMTGYWNLPDATSAAFVDGYYRTGDVVERDVNGYYYIVDRQRDMIISGGLNVYPAEVERVISAHPGVAEVAVVGIPDPHWGESVAAFVVRRSGIELDEAALVEHCRLQLASYKKPRSVIFTTQLPKGSTGKVLKRELREPYWRDVSRPIA